MPEWKDFEKLAELILAELDRAATVKHNDQIFGHETQKERQIDVSIRWSADGDDYLTIVQSKDHKTPADINKVGEFLAVVNDVKANGGILICTSGFTKDAHVYARNVGISLLNLHDAESTKWARALTIPILWNELEPSVDLRGEIFLEAGDSIPTHDPLGIPLTESDENSRINPVSTFQDYWNKDEINRTPGVVHRVVPERPLKAIVRDINGDVKLRPVIKFSIDYTVGVKTWLGKFQPSQCRGIIDYLDHQAFTASYLPTSESRWALSNRT